MDNVLLIPLALTTLYVVIRALVCAHRLARFLPVRAIEHLGENFYTSPVSVITIRPDHISVLCTLLYHRYEVIVLTTDVKPLLEKYKLYKVPRAYQSSRDRDITDYYKSHLDPRLLILHTTSVDVAIAAQSARFPLLAIIDPEVDPSALTPTLVRTMVRVHSLWPARPVVELMSDTLFNSLRRPRFAVTLRTRADFANPLPKPTIIEPPVAAIIRPSESLSHALVVAILATISVMDPALALPSLVVGLTLFLSTALSRHFLTPARKKF